MLRPISIRRFRPGRPGFTLIELLVVIGIIALLVGILVPVLSSVRRAGKATVCMSNMRQLATANNAYVLDHNKYLPQPAQEDGLGSDEAAGQHLWFNALDYYLDQQSKEYEKGETDERNYVTFKQDPVWIELPDDAPGTEPDRRNQQTFKMNAFFGNTNLSTPSGEPDVAFFKITDVPSPAETMLYIDGRAFDTPSTTTGNVDGDDFHTNTTLVGLRHDGGANMTKVDGSVAFENNPVETTGSGYEGWYDPYDNTTFTDEDRSLWPRVVFNFRPKEFGFDRRYSAR